MWTMRNAVNENHKHDKTYQQPRLNHQYKYQFPKVLASVLFGYPTLDALMESKLREDHFL